MEEHLLKILLLILISHIDPKNDEKLVGISLGLVFVDDIVYTIIPNHRYIMCISPKLKAY